MFPAALAIVVAAFPLRERGRAMAIFFGISGGLTAIGPIAGGYPDEWTWRAIFWINIPVAIDRARPDLASRARRRAAHPAKHRLPRRGADHRRRWGSSCSGSSRRACGAGAARATWACIVVGLALLRRRSSRWELRDRASRCCSCGSSATAASRSTTLVLGLISIVFVPFFFFAQRLRAGRRSARPPSQAGPLHPVLLPRLRDRRADRRADPRPARRAAGRSCSAARSARSASTCSPAAHRPRRSAASGRTSCSPAPGSG